VSTGPLPDPNDPAQLQRRIRAEEAARERLQAAAARQASGGSAVPGRSGSATRPAHPPLAPPPPPPPGTSRAELRHPRRLDPALGLPPPRPLPIELRPSTAPRDGSPARAQFLAERAKVAVAHQSFIQQSVDELHELEAALQVQNV
jgi:hypothetical protein